MIKVKNADMAAVYAAVAKKMPLFLPVEKAGEVNYGPWEEGAKVRTDVLKTVKSAKDFFFPQSETMMKFRTEGKNIEIEDDRKEVAPFVIFGVRGCDCKSFEVLDNVFLQQPVDTYYQAKRNACTSAT